MICGKLLACIRMFSILSYAICHYFYWTKNAKEKLLQTTCYVAICYTDCEPLDQTTANTKKKTACLKLLILWTFIHLICTQTGSIVD